MKQDILDAWGDLDVSGGFIQRSVRPPFFSEPIKFLSWLETQGVELMRSNNQNTETDRVVIVHLRRPKRGDPKEMRSDPFWEFGSFGCTGCHRRNLMNSKRIEELEGVRLAFAQGGPKGFRLVMLTPPVHVVKHRHVSELVWKPAKMPFKYSDAPLLIGNDESSDFPLLKRELEFIDRLTWEAAFSSRFRSCRTPVEPAIATELVRIYDERRKAAKRGGLAKDYTEALPYQPRLPDTNREATYKQLQLKANRGQRKKSCGIPKAKSMK